jgi:hypothetical protein
MSLHGDKHSRDDDDSDGGGAGGGGRVHKRARTDLTDALPPEMLERVAAFIPDGRSRCAFACASRRCFWAMRDVRGPSALLVDACQSGCSAVARWMLDDARTDPTVACNLALRWGCWNGHAGVVRMLLQDARVDPTAVDHAALRFASAHGHAAVARLLFRDGRADLRAKRGFALSACLPAVHRELAALVVAHVRAGAAPPPPNFRWFVDRAADEPHQRRPPI